MTDQSAIRRQSLLERAAGVYDFGSALRAPAPVVAPTPAPIPPAHPPRPAEPAPDVSAQRQEAIPPIPAEAPPPAARPAPAAAPPRRAGAGAVKVDRSALKSAGFIQPDAPITGLAEEFRLVKRQLLAGVVTADKADARQRTVLISSARPDEGKTFCAINLALSLSAERDMEVLLVDGDFTRPAILRTLGIEAGPGLVDALADEDADPEAFVIRTDLPGLSVLAAGRQENDVPELLASERTRAVLARLGAAHPRRIILFDSPPALMASPASVLSTLAAQVVVVVRADRTTEADLRETVALLSGCDKISLLLNGAAFAVSNRRYGSYNGYGQ